MGRASRANPQVRGNTSRAQALASPPRGYQPGDLQHGDVVTLGTSPTRWRVSERDGVITFKPIGSLGDEA